MKFRECKEKREIKKKKRLEISNPTKIDDSNSVEKYETNIR